MPKITTKEIKKVQYVSMADFSEKLQQYDRIDEKIRFATKYLLQYRNVDEDKADYTFEEAVHLARMEIAEVSLARRKKFSDQKVFKDNPQTVDPNYPGSTEDLDNEFFMGNPQTYLAGHTVLIDKDLTIDEIKEKDYYEALFYGKAKERLEAVEKNSNAIDIRYRLEKRIGSKKEVEDAYKATKPGFWSRTFNTSSIQYKHLDTMWKNFNNPNHASYGEINGLQKASNEYLQYKFPGWKEGDPITNEMILSLDKTEAARVNFCVNINAAIKEQKAVQSEYKEMINACSEQKIRFKDVENLSPMQNLFQKQIEAQLALEDYENEEEVQNSNDSIEAHNDNEIHQEEIENN